MTDKEIIESFLNNDQMGIRKAYYAWRMPFDQSVSRLLPNDEDRADAYYMGFTSNYNDRLALCYYMTDLLEIYDIEGKNITKLPDDSNVVEGAKKALVEMEILK